MSVDARHAEFGTFAPVELPKIVDQSTCDVCHRPYDSRLKFQIAFECDNASCHRKVHAACISKWVVRDEHVTCPTCKSPMSAEDLELIRDTTDSHVIRLEKRVNRLESKVDQIIDVLKTIQEQVASLASRG